MIFGGSFPFSCFDFVIGDCFIKLDRICIYVNKDSSFCSSPEAITLQPSLCFYSPAIKLTSKRRKRQILLTLWQMGKPLPSTVASVRPNFQREYACTLTHAGTSTWISNADKPCHQGELSVEALTWTSAMSPAALISFIPHGLFSSRNNHAKKTDWDRTRNDHISI